MPMGWWEMSLTYDRIPHSMEIVRERIRQQNNSKRVKNLEEIIEDIKRKVLKSYYILTNSYKINKQFTYN